MYTDGYENVFSDGTVDACAGAGTTCASLCRNARMACNERQNTHDIEGETLKSLVWFYLVCLRYTIVVFPVTYLQLFVY